MNNSSRKVSIAVVLALLALVISWKSALWAQTFNSGSTGADGAFNPTCPVGQTSCTVTVTLPANGIFNFTTINIANGIIVKFTRNTLNTPVIMLASGDVTIQGVIDVSGQNAGGSVLGVAYPGRGGPGGYDGGLGGRAGTFLLSVNGSPGLGPGGGMGGDASAVNTCEKSGKGASYRTWGSNPCNGSLTNNGGTAPYGVHTLYPIVGGSGGGGGAGNATLDGGGGGGGGGAILIASSAKITFQQLSGSMGVIRAQSGGGYSCTSVVCANAGNTGSGGAIRVVANQIVVGSNYDPFNVNPFSLSQNCATNGSTFISCFNGGRVRLEAFTLDWGLTIPEYSRGLPGPLVFPTLKIASIGGVAAPSDTVGTFVDSTDVILDPSLSNPITVNLAASNVPLGTVVQLTVVSEAVVAPVTVLSTPLAGTLLASTATASVTLPPGASVITVTATFAAAP